MLRFTLFLAFAFLFLPAGAPAASALTLRSASLAVLVSESDRVLVGEVIWTRVEHVPNRRWHAQTRVCVLIWADEKGAGEPDLVEFLLPGGTLHGLQTKVPGVPTLQVGDVHLFLLESVHGQLRPLGYALGIHPAGSLQNLKDGELSRGVAP